MELLEIRSLAVLFGARINCFLGFDLCIMKYHVKCKCGGGRHNVKDTMPTDPTRTKRGRTKKGEKDPPQKTKRAAHRQPDIDVILRCNRNCQ